MVLPSSPDWPGIHRDLPASTPWVWGLKVCTTWPTGIDFLFVCLFKMCALELLSLLLLLPPPLKCWAVGMTRLKLLLNFIWFCLARLMNNTKILVWKSKYGGCLFVVSEVQCYSWLTSELTSAFLESRKGNPKPLPPQWQFCPKSHSF